MASASAIKAGETFVRMSLDSGDMEKSLKTIQNRLKSFASAAVKVGSVMAAIGGAGVFGLSRAVKAANDVELTGRRLEAVFQDSAEEARTFARVLARDIGESRFELEKTITTFKSFFAEIIASESDQKQFAQRMTELSRDFAAFQGLTATDALQRFISALSGSPEVLDRFGINLKAAAIDAEFAAMGLDVTTENAEEFLKVIARMKIIERTLGKQGAIGKATQELNTFAGALRASGNAVYDFTVAVGQALVPVLKPVVATFANLAQGFTVLAERAPLLTVAVGVLAVGALALGGTLIAAGFAATALAVSIASVTTIVTAYRGFVQSAGMQTAGFSAVLAAARAQLAGFAVGATSAAASAAGFGVSTTAAAAGLTVMRTALVSTMMVLGQAAVAALAISAVMGSVPQLSVGVVIGIMAIAASVIFLKNQFNKLNERIDAANKFFRQYSKITSKNLGNRGIIAQNTLDRATKLGIAAQFLGKRFMVVAFAGRLVAKAMSAIAAAGALVSSLVAGIAVGIGTLALGLFRLAQETGATARVADGFSSSWKKAFDPMQDTNWLGVFVQEYSTYMDKLIKKTNSTVDWITQKWQDGKDGLAILFGGQTEFEKNQQKMRAQGKADAEKNAADLIELDRKIQDAKIAGIKNTHARERAALKAETQRAIQDEIAKNTELQKIRDKHKQELSEMDQGVAGREARQAAMARQAVELQAAIDNNAAIVRIREEGSIKAHNLQMQQAEDLFRRRVELETRYTSARIEAVYDGAAEELAQVRLRHDTEMRLFKGNEEEKKALIAAQAQEQANVVAAFNKRVHDQAMSLQDEIRQAKIDSNSDIEQRELDSAQLEFNRRMAALEELKREQEELNRLQGDNADPAAMRNIIQQMNDLRMLFELRLEDVRKKHHRERLKEEEQLKEARERSLQSVQDTIDGLKIDLNTPEGLDRTLAKIELERNQAVREAKDDDKLIEKINEKFNLRAAIAKQQEATQSDPDRIFGATDFRQLKALRGGGQTKTDDLIKQGNELTKKQIDLFKEFFATQELVA